jgi:hypothetical protein
LSSGENAGYYSFEYMRDFFSGSPLEEKDLSYEATSNSFYKSVLNLEFKSFLIFLFLEKADFC